VFGDSGITAASASTAVPNGGGAAADLMNGFSGLDLSANTTSPPPGGNQQRKTNEDILSLF
jgi:hypothetical protein